MIRASCNSQHFAKFALLFVDIRAEWSTAQSEYFVVLYCNSKDATIYDNITLPKVSTDLEKSGNQFMQQLKARNKRRTFTQHRPNRWHTQAGSFTVQDYTGVYRPKRHATNFFKPCTRYEFSVLLAQKSSKPALDVRRTSTKVWHNLSRWISKQINSLVVCTARVRHLSSNALRIKQVS